MKTVNVEVYSIDELSLEAQEKAHENWLQNFEYFGHDENISALDEFQNIFPVNVKNWEYGYHYSLDYTFTETDEISELYGHRLATYLWNNYKDDLFKGKYYWSKSKHRHSKIQLENSCVLTGVWIDHELLQPIYDFLEKPDNRDFDDIMNECLQGWILASHRDHEHQASFEYFIEHAEMNEYQYLIDGRTTCF